MKPGHKHSDETKKKISENTKKAVKNLGPNKTTFKKGHQPWNTGLKGVLGANSGSFKPVPIGTITTRKNKGYSYQFIKTEQGWERYYVNGKPDRKINTSQKKTYFCLMCGKEGVANTNNQFCDDCKKIRKAAVNRRWRFKQKYGYLPTQSDDDYIVSVKKLKVDHKWEQQKKFLAKFGFNSNKISIPINRGVDNARV